MLHSKRLFFSEVKSRTGSQLIHGGIYLITAAVISLSISTRVKSHQDEILLMGTVKPRGETALGDAWLEQVAC